MVIEKSDRISDVLTRDEGLIETFVAASPVFERLRSPLMRKTMGRLTTVEQAARMAGLHPDLLIERLNRALAGKAGGGPRSAAPPAASGEERATSTEQNDSARFTRGGEEKRAMSSTESTVPPALAAIPADLIVDLDVRDDLRNGREPFSRIMAARREVPADGAFRLRAIFEPVPLYAVMAKQGFEHWTEELAPDDWRVSFYPAQSEAGTPAVPAVQSPAGTASGAPESPSTEGDEVMVLDVRGMEPPEPMVRTLAALEELPSGKTLLQINERVPQFLLPKLEELGFTYEVKKQSDALIRVFIRRRNDS